MHNITAFFILNTIYEHDYVIKIHNRYLNVFSHLILHFIIYADREIAKMEEDKIIFFSINQK